MADCGSLLTAGVLLNCADIDGAIGAEKDLILVNYEDYDEEATQAPANIEADNTNGNIGGLTAIKLKAGAIQYTFEGMDYSVQPNLTTEVKEDGNSWYIHSLLFTVYNKTSVARNTLEELGKGRVIAITVDKSTGLYELFGSKIGLKISALDRAYTGAQNSNFFQVTIVTPDIAVVREPRLPQLAVGIVTAV